MNQENQFHAVVEVAVPAATAVVNDLARLVFEAIKPQLRAFVRVAVAEAVKEERTGLEELVEDVVTGQLESTRFERNMSEQIDREVERAIDNMDFERTIEREVESQLSNITDELFEGEEFEDGVKEILRSSLSLSVD